MISLIQLLALLVFLSIFALPYSLQTPLSALFVGLMIAALIKQVEATGKAILEAYGRDT